VLIDKTKHRHVVAQGADQFHHFYCSILWDMIFTFIECFYALNCIHIALLRKFPKALKMSGSLDCRIALNFSSRDNASKLEINFLVVSKSMDRWCSWEMQIIRQCSSSSVSFEEHLSHILFISGVIGRSCLPVSTFRLWELHRNLAILVYIFLFVFNVRYGSNRKSVLNCLYVLN